MNGKDVETAGSFCTNVCMEMTKRVEVSYEGLAKAGG